MLIIVALLPGFGGMATLTLFGEIQTGMGDAHQAGLVIVL